MIRKAYLISVPSREALSRARGSLPSEFFYDELGETIGALPQECDRIEGQGWRLVLMSDLEAAELTAAVKAYCQEREWRAMVTT